MSATPIWPSSNRASAKRSIRRRLPFADLNYQEVAWTKNRGRRSKLEGFYFPQSVAEADLIVSLPKMKTHHWVGVTAAMKNLYGTIPGCKYGWPKNVLHYSGIPETVFDINASLPQDDRHRRWHRLHGRRRPDHGHAQARWAWCSSAPAPPRSMRRSAG